MVDMVNYNYISQTEVARRLGVTPQAVHTAIRTKRLQAVLIAGRYVIEEKEVERFANNRTPEGWAGYHAKRRKKQKKK